MNLLDAFALYQSSYGLSDATIRNRSSVIRRIEDPTNATIDDLRRLLSRPMKPSTRRVYLCALRAFYRWMIEDGLRDDDPTIRLHAARVPAGTPRPFTPEQIDALLHSGAYKRTRMMILLGCYEGFRVSQIAATRGEDIDRISRTIRTISKGGKELRLPLHPSVDEAAKMMPRSGWWFPARRGRPGHIDGHSVSDLIRRARERAGIIDPRLTAHSLRHSFGSHMVDADVDIRVVQTLMGHESLATTQVYTAVSERRRTAGIAALPVRPLIEHSERRRAA